MTYARTSSVKVCHTASNAARVDRIAVVPSACFTSRRWKEKTALLFFACPINKSHLHPPTSLRVIFKLSRSPRKQTTRLYSLLQSSATYSYTFQKHRPREITELTITLVIHTSHFRSSLCPRIHPSLSNCHVRESQILNLSEASPRRGGSASSSTAGQIWNIILRALESFRVLLQS